MDSKSLISRINGPIRGVKYCIGGMDRDLTEFPKSFVSGFFSFFSLYCRWINVRPRMSIFVCLSFNLYFIESISQLMLRLPSIIPPDLEDRARIVIGNSNKTMIITIAIPIRSQIISIVIGFNWSLFHRFSPYFSLPSSICIFPSFPALSL